MLPLLGGPLGSLLCLAFSDVLRELQSLDEAVAGKWGGTVDLDLAVMADRQGIGGPSAHGD